MCKQDRVGQDREREARVRGGEGLVDLHRGHGVQARAPEAFRDRDAEQPQFARALEEFEVEAFLAVVFGGLGFDLARYEGTQRLGQ